jgi:hypothetical protein
VASHKVGEQGASIIVCHLTNGNYRLINWLFFGQPPRAKARHMGEKFPRSTAQYALWGRQAHADLQCLHVRLAEEYQC